MTTAAPSSTSTSPAMAVIPNREIRASTSLSLTTSSGRACVVAAIPKNEIWAFLSHWLVSDLQLHRPPTARVLGPYPVVPPPPSLVAPASASPPLVRLPQWLCVRHPHALSPAPCVRHPRALPRWPWCPHMLPWRGCTGCHVLRCRCPLPQHPSTGMPQPLLLDPFSSIPVALSSCRAQFR
jgi:hypothetical protein